MRALSLFMVVLFFAAVPATAEAKPPKAKIALGAKKKAAKKKKRAKVTAKRAAAPAAPTACANTTTAPGDLAAFRAAIVCLHNLTRAQHGLPGLVENGALAAAGAGHAGDMVARRYFAHDTPEGGSFDDRIDAAGYAGSTLGENLGWATGEQATPAALMSAWMSSPGHRANILKAAYRELGLGVTVGSPLGSDGVTVAVEFGAR